MLTDFGKELRKIRIDNNEFLKDMANKLGVTVSYLSAVENGKRDIPDEWLNKIINDYNLSKNEIINLKNALYISKQEVNISLSHLNDSRKQAAMSFAREFNDFSDEDINDILTMLKKLKGV